MTDNPGPGVRYCPACLHGSICFSARWVGKASDDNVEIECPKCKAVVKKTLTWNEAKTDALLQRIRQEDGSMASGTHSAGTPSERTCR